jgi:hypothetical protein
MRYTDAANNDTTVPEFLQQREQWVVWYAIKRADKERLEKYPLSLSHVRAIVDAHEQHGTPLPRNIERGNANDAANMTSFEDACALAAYIDASSRTTKDTTTGAGVGFALRGDDQVVAFDFDNVLDAKGQVVDTRIVRLLRELATYTERSPGGKGLHAIVAVSPAMKRKIFDRVGTWTSFTDRANGGSQHTVYVGGGFVTITGWAHTMSQDINTRADAQLERWMGLRFPAADDTRTTRADDPDLEDGGVETQVHAALDAIDADCDRDTWIKVGMVLHRLSQGDTRGLRLWEAWSSRAPHRVPRGGEPSCARLYKSFKMHQRGINLGTLIALGNEWGRSDKQIAHAKERLVRTIADAKERLRELARERGVYEQSTGVDHEGLRIVGADTLIEEPTQWNLTHFIPFGHIAILSGPVGTGKSSWLIKFAADVTHARSIPWDINARSYRAHVDDVLRRKGRKPESPYARSGIVYYLTAEMHWTQTFLPTFNACGGVPSNCKLIRYTGVMGRDGNVQSRPFDLVRDIDSLVRAIVESNTIPDLIVLDPITSFMGTQMDRNAEGDVRTVLELLGDFCASTGTSIVDVLHQNKSLDQQGVGKLLGSVAFGAVARVVLFVTGIDSATPAEEHADEWEHRRKTIGVLVEKSNIGPANEAMLFDLEPARDSFGLDVKYREHIAVSMLARMTADAKAAKSGKGAGGEQRMRIVATLDALQSTKEFVGWASIHAAAKGIVDATDDALNFDYVRQVLTRFCTRTPRDDNMFELKVKVQ